MGSAIYDGNFMDLKKHNPFGDGECAAMPQALTNVGHTSKWRPGLRVMDLVYLQPGTVIANFKFMPGFLRRFPNEHGYHASLFVEFAPKSMSTGEPLGIVVIDQWSGRMVLPRTIIAYTEEQARKRRVYPSDNANEFYVVMS
jgi:hypothetical protein